MDLTTQARKLFEQDRYAVGTTGVEIVSVEEQHAVCSLLADDGHRNAAGIVMGGALFTLADFACSVAANAALLAAGETERLWLTLNASINYLRATKGGLLTATAHCIKAGRTTCLYTTDITDENGVLIATIQSTGIRPI